MPRHPERRRKNKPTPKREPVAYAAVASVFVGVLAFFGLDISEEVASAIVGAVILVGGLWARSQVTPTDE